MDFELESLSFHLLSEILVQCRLRGKLDSNGVVAAFLEERLNMGVNFILSAEVSRTLVNKNFLYPSKLLNLCCISSFHYHGRACQFAD